jgi:hypothetical protein
MKKKKVTRKVCTEKTAQASRLNGKNGGKKSPESRVDPDQLYALAKMGATNKEIQKIFKISDRALLKFASAPGYREALAEGKKAANDRVKSSLYLRAVGFQYDEITREPVIDAVAGQKILRNKTLQVTKKVTKTALPDIGAINTWLCNKDGDWQSPNSINVHQHTNVRVNKKEEGERELDHDEVERLENNIRLLKQSRGYTTL